MTDQPAAEPPPVAVERRGAVALVRLDRPAERNALSNDVLELLAAELLTLDRDPAARCLVLAGSEKVFASGADVRALAGQEAVELYFGRRFSSGRAAPPAHADRRRGLGLLPRRRLRAGAALRRPRGIGDRALRPAGDRPRADPRAGGTQRLARAIGKAKAMDVVLSGRLLSAAEAEQGGLVARVTPAAEWLDRALALADEIAERAPIAQLLARDAVARSFETPLEAGLDLERRAFTLAFATADAREGIGAFLAKRDPVWQGR